MNKRSVILKKFTLKITKTKKNDWKFFWLRDSRKFLSALNLSRFIIIPLEDMEGLKNLIRCFKKKHFLNFKVKLVWEMF